MMALEGVSISKHGAEDCPYLGRLLAQIGRREDYKRNDHWGNPVSHESNKWRDKIPSGLPISYSGAILALCVIIFFIKLVIPVFVDTYLALIPAYLFQRPWTLVTYMFVHANFDHLFWNMLFLFFFGVLLENRIGSRRFLGIFLLSGIVAAIAQILVSNPYTIMMGASGALFGVLGCLAIIAPEIRVLLFFVIPLSVRWAVVLYAFIEFLSMGSVDNIAHMAHVFGLLVGLAAGYAMKRQPKYYYDI